jgi:organic hydroperoxide reductase OsmC/OhrA
MRSGLRPLPGNGTVRLGSDLETPYTFKTRLRAPRARTRRLLGAAHAACFTMALGAL